MTGADQPPHRLPDAPARNLAERLAPAFALPFVQLARLDRPIGWQLLLAPCWWSSALASLAAGQAPNLLHLALFLIGAVAMRGAGSTYNDIVDRDIDARVERTRGRPLPSGRASLFAARAFLVLQALIGLAVLLSFNRFAILVGVASLVIVALYPFAKRVTSWPQAVLGLAFAWGALMGWAVERGALAAPAIWLYAAAVFWTIGYDTVYAVQDRRDDPAAGVRSTARLFGARVREGVSTLYLLTTLCASAALYTAGAGLMSWLGLFAFSLHLMWQSRKLAAVDATTALMLFRSNRDAGLLLFAGLFVDALTRAL
ncbi:MAG: 4-hydroxybenzoate octaprenyltransferase [Methylobacteriaceae bacterium]|nr:4-hydroxybenzoate octaprenyltransferase [Methylobacteriaceae bacterium]